MCEKIGKKEYKHKYQRKKSLIKRFVWVRENDRFRYILILPVFK